MDPQNIRMSKHACCCWLIIAIFLCITSNNNGNSHLNNLCNAVQLQQDITSYETSTTLSLGQDPYWLLPRKALMVIYLLPRKAFMVIYPLWWQVPKGWDRLFVSLVSVETGKTIAKSGKASVRNGTCRWTETFSESIFISQENVDSEELEGGHFKFVVAMVRS